MLGKIGLRTLAMSWCGFLFQDILGYTSNNMINHDDHSILKICAGGILFVHVLISI